MSANTRLDCLWDLGKHRANLAVECRCGRRHVFDVARFKRYAMLKGWNTQLESLRIRIRCSACGRIPDRLRATPDPPTTDDPFPRDERGWKMLERRMRN